MAGDRLQHATTRSLRRRAARAKQIRRGQGCRCQRRRVTRRARLDTRRPGPVGGIERPGGADRRGPAGGGPPKRRRPARGADSRRARPRDPAGADRQRPRAGWARSSARRIDLPLRAHHRRHPLPARPLRCRSDHRAPRGPRRPREPPGPRRVCSHLALLHTSMPGYSPRWMPAIRPSTSWRGWRRERPSNRPAASTTSRGTGPRARSTEARAPPGSAFGCGRSPRCRGSRGAARAPRPCLACA